MTTNNKQYQSNYMKNYIINSKKIICSLCNKEYKKVYEYRHFQSKNHKTILEFNKNFNNLKNLIINI